LQKNIIPCILKFLGDTKPELKAASTKIFQMLYDIMGKGLYEIVPPNKTAIVNELLNVG
jgi:hypothetical protein